MAPPSDRHSPRSTGDLDRTAPGTGGLVQLQDIQQRIDYQFQPHRRQFETPTQRIAGPIQITVPMSPWLEVYLAATEKPRGTVRSDQQAAWNRRSTPISAPQLKTQQVSPISKLECKSVEGDLPL
jgi:hypothetical protein